MKVSVLICTCGAAYWRNLARSRAVPSARGQGAREIITRHDPDLDRVLNEVRNAAAGQATGDWLCFLDGTDQLAPGYLAAMENAVASTPQADDGFTLLAPAVALLDEHGSPLGGPKTPEQLCAGRPMIEANRCAVGTLVPRRLFEAVGGFYDWTLYGEWELFLRCLVAGARIVDVPAAVYRDWHAPEYVLATDAHDTYWRIRRLYEADLTSA